MDSQAVTSEFPNRPWDCPRCNEMNAGDSSFCDDCGRRRRGNEHFSIIRERKWICTRCSRANEGSLLCCKGCGDPRAEADGEDFKKVPGAHVVVDPVKLMIAQGGKDINCSACGGDNRGTAKRCRGCGKPLGEKGDVLRGTKRLRAHVESASTNFRRSRPVRFATSNVQRASSKIKNDMSRTQQAMLGSAALAVVLLLCYGFWFFFLATKPLYAEVSGYYWKRVTPVRNLVSNSKEGWSKPPVDARITWQGKKHSHDEPIYETRTRNVKKQIQTGTKREKVGEEDLGNGFSRDIMEDVPVYTEVDDVEEYQVKVGEKPIYKTYYKYDIDEWEADTPAVAEGKNHKAYDPSVTTHDRREKGVTRSYYTVYFEPADASLKTKQYSFNTKNHSEWLGFVKERKYILHVTVLGKVRRVEEAL